MSNEQGFTFFFSAFFFIVLHNNTLWPNRLIGPTKELLARERPIDSAVDSSLSRLLTDDLECEHLAKLSLASAS